MSKLRDRLFQSWFRFSRPMTLGVRALIVDPDKHVLLLRHTYTPGWHFPGGGVEKGEPAIEALGRELIEEAGVVPVRPPALLGVFSNQRTFPNDHTLFYLVEHWRQEAATSRGEIAEVRWVDPITPPDGTTPGTRRRLEEFVNGGTTGPYW